MKNLKSKRTQSLIQFGLIVLLIVFVNILGAGFHFSLDLTEEKRYTLSQPTRKLLRNVDEVVYARVLLDGEFPAEVKRFQRAVTETLDDFRSLNGFVEYRLEDPNEGTVEEINERRKQLAEEGITPINWPIRKAGERTELLVYPHAIFSYKGREVVVNLFENDPAIPKEVQINNSIGLLEYKFANAIKKLQTSTKPAILFTAGRGELEANQVGDLIQSLLPYYNMGPLFLDSITQIHPDVACLIVAKPTKPFTERDKFKLDQYVMNGGRIIWLIDKLGVALDSLRRASNDFIPLERPLNLDDMLFNYGVRIQPNLILDLRSSKIMLETDRQGSRRFFDWFYFPIIFPATDHAIVKSLDGIDFQFPSSIDTIRTKTPVEKTVLLASSEKTRLQFPPGARLNFEILRYPPDPEKFDKGPQPVAVLLEGIFPSLYQNRIKKEMEEGLKAIGQEFRAESVKTKMLVVSDGDVIRNELDPQRGTAFPLGYNRVMRYTFANKDFLINAIEYLLDDSGLIQARTKEVKLRPLDRPRIDAEKGKWQLINIAMPLVFLIAFGIGYNFMRRRRYTSTSTST